MNNAAARNARTSTAVILTIGLVVGIVTTTTAGFITIGVLAAIHIGLRLRGRNGLVHERYNFNTKKYRLIVLAGAFRRC